MTSSTMRALSLGRQQSLLELGHPSEPPAKTENLTRHGEPACELFYHPWNKIRKLECQFLENV